MVGHTGVFSAAVKAVETVDACNQAVTEAARKNGYAVIIIADHGNAELMVMRMARPILRTPPFWCLAFSLMTL